MEVPGTPQGEAPTRCDSDADVVFYMEEPKAGKKIVSYFLLIRSFRIPVKSQVGLPFLVKISSFWLPT